MVCVPPPGGASTCSEWSRGTNEDTVRDGWQAGTLATAPVAARMQAITNRRVIIYLHEREPPWNARRLN
jgi:hypothetical protein